MLREQYHSNICAFSHPISHSLRKLNMWYLHGPDRTTPYEVTMKAVNDLYKEGCVHRQRHKQKIDMPRFRRLFDRFGISNFMAYVYRGH